MLGLSGRVGLGELGFTVGLVVGFGDGFDVGSGDWGNVVGVSVGLGVGRNDRRSTAVGPWDGERLGSPGAVVGIEVCLFARI